MIYKKINLLKFFFMFASSLRDKSNGMQAEIKIDQSEPRVPQPMRSEDVPDGEFSAFKWKRFGFFEMVFKLTSLKFVELNKAFISGSTSDRK